MTEATGCTARTVRYYERQGLLEAARTVGGHRQFAPSQLERLSLIVALRAAGWSLEDVTAMFDLRAQASDDASACAQLGHALDDQIERLQAQLALLSRLRDELTQTADVLSTCRTCTAAQPRVACEGCEQLPGLDALPRPFRIVWRGSELDAAADDDVVV